MKDCLYRLKMGFLHVLTAAIYCMVQEMRQLSNAVCDRRHNHRPKENIFGYQHVWKLHNNFEMKDEHEAFLGKRTYHTKYILFILHNNRVITTDLYKGLS